MAKKKFLLLFLLCSLLPLAFAQAFLSLGWFGGATTNKGQWLTEEIVLLPKAEGDVHWRLVYVSDNANCDAACQNAHYAMQQVYTALGRKQQHVELWQSGGVQPEHLLWQTSPVGVDALQHKLVLVDLNGLALMTYAVSADKAQMVQTGKAMLTDLNKLLKYDRGL
ncbi:hypothetical protein EIK76_16510 [Rheinheimera mesophila]|uniref:Transmembrane cytochrome oxidase associated protein n=1 Tax=Rheinheimera mesophila TaxID=1547515 RepID=A0A3P3QCG7_9GAMM|nr:hypothetical protein [Rheinheimera mesophila]KKL01725.1 hypothetical protein SD53_08410 [Rheinheimera mesophila]RRJ18821.1 hypothetical protein EIK76_16510 [Rheinheimera mesophila]